VRNYWVYFSELEKQLLDTKKYAEFDSKNKVYSREYLQLFQAICSEIDVIGKELAILINPSLTINKDTNIKRWGYEIQQKYPDIKDTIVIFDSYMIQQPFKRWEYVENEITDVNGVTKHILKQVYDKSVQWWKDYNMVKHRRLGLVSNTKNYHLANQKNVILSLSALYILETLMMKELEMNINDLKSQLFAIKTEGKHKYD
jgi:hypothetical protein